MSPRPPIHHARSRTLFVALLVLALVPLVPGGYAQATAGGLPEPGETLVPEAANVQSVLTDAEGDVENVVGEQDPAPSALAERVDLLDLTLAEDAQSIAFRMTHVGYDENAFAASGAAFGNWECAVDWHFSGDDKDRRWGVRLRSFFVNDIWAEMYVQETEEVEENGFARTNTDYLGWVPWVFLGDSWEVVFPKHVVEIDDDRMLQVGDKLEDIEVSCWGSSAFFVQHRDDVALETSTAGSGKYALTVAPGSESIDLGLPKDARASGFATAPGVPKKFELAIVNKEPHKLLVNVTAAFLPYPGTPAEGWKVATPPTIEVRGANSTTFSVVVTPPTEVRHSMGGVIRVTALVLGTDSPATFQYPVRVAEPLTPETRTLYWHNQGESFYCNIFSCFINEDLVPENEVVASPTRYFALNPLDDDPNADDESSPAGPVSNDDGQDYLAYLDTPLVKPLQFDLEQRIVSTIGLSSSLPREYLVEMELWDGTDDVLIGTGSATATLTESVTEVQVSMPVRDDAEAIPAGHWLYLDFSISDAELDWYVCGGCPGENVRIHPDASRLELPLVHVAEPELQITDGRAIPTLRLRNGTDAEEFVNPGKSREFELALVNEGVALDVLDVNVQLDKPGWSAQILPGKRFELEPGRAAPFSVVVNAPRDAAEGETLVINLSAASRNDADVRTSLSLRAIIVTGIEFDDERYTPAPEDESVAPYLGDAEESPVASPVVSMALIGAAMWVRRRLGS